MRISGTTVAGALPFPVSKFLKETCGGAAVEPFAALSLPVPLREVFRDAAAVVEPLGGVAVSVPLRGMFCDAGVIWAALFLAPSLFMILVDSLAGTAVIGPLGFGLFLVLLTGAVGNAFAAFLPLFCILYSPTRKHPVRILISLQTEENTHAHTKSHCLLFSVYGRILQDPWRRACINNRFVGTILNNFESLTQVTAKHFIQPLLTLPNPPA
jgi:hypothetical protein